LQSIQELDNSFKGLYDTRTSEQGQNERGGRKPGERFMQVFGWHYTAEQIREYYGIGLDQVYELRTIEALNAMSYLKGKAKYIEELSRG
jgi:hypothetical protein